MPVGRQSNTDCDELVPSSDHMRDDTMTNTDECVRFSRGQHHTVTLAEYDYNSSITTPVRSNSIEDCHQSHRPAYALTCALNTASSSASEPWMGAFFHVTMDTCRPKEAPGTHGY